MAHGSLMRLGTVPASKRLVIDHISGGSLPCQLEIRVFELYALLFELLSGTGGPAATSSRDPRRSLALMPGVGHRYRLEPARKVHC